MNKILSALALAGSGLLAWEQAHPMVVAMLVLGAFGVLSDEAAKHPRLQGALRVAAALGFDITKIRDGVVQLLTGQAPTAEEIAVVDSAVDKVVK
jgi:hypothetical protein